MEQDGLGNLKKLSQTIETEERETGIEPATSSLGSWHSTAELLPLTDEAYNTYSPFQNLVANTRALDTVRL